MSDSLDVLYHKQMLSLTQNPILRSEENLLQGVSWVRNPMCGDALYFGYYQKKIHWCGEGCLICLASAEALCQRIQNINHHSKIETICIQIQEYFNGQSDIIDNKFLPFASVKQVKTRINCVILSTQGVIKLIKGCNE